MGLTLPSLQSSDDQDVPDKALSFFASSNICQGIRQPLRRRLGILGGQAPAEVSVVGLLRAREETCRGLTQTSCGLLMHSRTTMNVHTYIYIYMYMCMYTYIFAYTCKMLLIKAPIAECIKHVQTENRSDSYSARL